MDRLEEWRTFVAVAGLRSFSGAARSLGRSPQGVTRAVASLEARLGTRLLNRTTRAVSLTDAGERLLESGRRVLADFDLLESRSGEGAPVSGRMTITAPVLFGRLHVLPVLVDFLGQHPGVDARLLLVDRVVSLAEEGVDLAVRLGPLADSALRVKHLGEVREVLCASASYLSRAGVPRSPEALSNHACIAFTGTTPLSDRWSFPSRNGRGRSVSVRPRLVVNTGQAAIDAAASGLGIVRVLSYQVAGLLAAKKLQIVLPSFTRESVPVQLVYLPGAPARVARAFMDFAAPRITERLRP